MILTYKPDDGPPEEYEFIPGLLMNAEAEVIEAVGDYAWSSFEEFGAAFFRGNARARRVALWIMKKRKDPRLKLDQVIFRSNQVDVDYSPRERQLILEAMLADPDLEPAQREQIAKDMEEDQVSETEEKLADAGIVREPDPKDQPSYFGDDGSISAIPVSPPD